MASPPEAAPVRQRPACPHENAPRLCGLLQPRAGGFERKAASRAERCFLPWTRFPVASPDPSMRSRDCLCALPLVLAPPAGGWTVAAAAALQRTPRPAVRLNYAID